MQLHVIKNESGLDEWMMIEMQGVIENGEQPLGGEMMGNIGWRKDNSEALLLIGHHLLEGKVSNMERPLLVMAPHSDGDRNEKQLVVEAVVRRRLVFKNRPKPIVTKQVVKKSVLANANK